VAERCPDAFDETLLSGYVDRALTQGADQRVRIHLEDCAHCRTLVADLRALRDLTMSSRFELPADTQWSETPRGLASRLARNIGWVLLITWAVVMAGAALVAFLRADGSLLEKLLPLAGLAGVALLFLAVLIDRLKVLKTDRYREVQK
jgi:anti-sigma factor RsiW